MDNSESTLKIKTGSFEGPLSVLLELIEARKLFINEISLAEVTDDFIAYIKEKAPLPLGETTQFVSIAATLILIKSRSLLPNLSLTEDEEEKIVDLEKRLVLYKIIREATTPLGNAFGKNSLFFGEERAFETHAFAPGPELTKSSLFQALGGVLENIPVPTFHPEVRITETISIDEMIEKLKDRIQEATQLSFNSFSRKGGNQSKEEKVFVIVSFLAMLELIREGLLAATQDDVFGDIAIEKQAVTHEEENTINEDN